MPYKSLFTYASKELSQDAFLRWLFENYRCDCPTVREACRRLFEAFTRERNLNFDDIQDLKTVAQWKRIDVAIWFRIKGEDYLIAIEDKTASDLHGDQLNHYSKEINKHNAWWREHENDPKYPYPERYTKQDGHELRIYYKTDVIREAEKTCIEKEQGWKVFDIFDICDLLGDIVSENDVLRDYVSHLHDLRRSAKREAAPREWDLVAWHSFFADYEIGIDARLPYVETEIGHYQNSYYYIKFLLKNHKTDRPAVELRSNKYSAREHTWEALINLYHIDPQPTQEQIDRWQATLTANGIELNNRKDISTHKQIGNYLLPVTDDTETALREALDSAIARLTELYGKD